MIIYRSIDDDNDHRGASRMILSFFSPSQYADQGDWESARVSIGRWNDDSTDEEWCCSGEEEQWELFLRIPILKL